MVVGAGGRRHGVDRCRGVGTRTDREPGGGQHAAPTVPLDAGQVGLDALEVVTTGAQHRQRGAQLAERGGPEPVVDAGDVGAAVLPPDLRPDHHHGPRCALLGGGERQLDADRDLGTGLDVVDGDGRVVTGDERVVVDGAVELEDDRRQRGEAVGTVERVRRTGTRTELVGEPLRHQVGRHRQPAAGGGGRVGDRELVARVRQGARADHRRGARGAGGTDGQRTGGHGGARGRSQRDHHQRRRCQRPCGS